MIDLAAEMPIPLADACRLIPPGRGGKQTHLSTLLRWILKGVKGPDGAIVRLDAIRLGGRWVTSREAIQRFAEHLTPRVADEPGPAPRSPGRRHRASERAAKQLEKLGV